MYKYFDTYIGEVISSFSELYVIKVVIVSNR
jgi:hypothetical protein